MVLATESLCRLKPGMSFLRIIARLDIKGPNLIKGVQLEGVRVIGDPREYAMRYYHDGADELVYMDAVASLYGRNSLAEVVRYTAEHIFVPLTVGGGIRNLADVEMLLRAGADKVAINTAAVRRPELITEVARRFGSQCIVLQVDAKRRAGGGWEAYVDGGREKTGRDAVQWVREGIDRGVGEILLTSVDQEGTRRGMDLSLIGEVVAASSVPVIASGGVGEVADIVAAATVTNCSAIAVADVLHYKRTSLNDIRVAVASSGLPVRKP
jgi:cyclase